MDDYKCNECEMQEIEEVPTLTCTSCNTYFYMDVCHGKYLPMLHR